MSQIRLTQHAKRAGCAAKHPPGYLFPLLAGLPKVEDPNVLVGSATADDAAVYKLTDELALVLTTDFFTPIVDDPFDFGAIAAANALSDVYAMGGKPITALNLVGFPDELDGTILTRMLEGGARKAKEAGIDIVGGHTIKTDEPIYGLAVTGTIHPKRILSNAGARPGDALILTKPVGIGIVTTAAKQDKDSLGAIREAIDMMSTLNRAACEAMLEVGGATAVTDITGFGLVGHLRNIVRASSVSATLRFADIPVLEAARKYVADGIAPGGTHANLRFLKDSVQFDVAKEAQLIACDAQTSGGLLISIPESRAEALIDALKRHGAPVAARVGTIAAENPGQIRVVA
jgi:selenide, water dikinase